jgi:hypothetical protein
MATLDFTELDKKPPGANGWASADAAPVGPVTAAVGK